MKKHREIAKNKSKGIIVKQQKSSYLIGRRYKSNYIEKAKEVIQKSKIIDSNVKDIVVSKLINCNSIYKIPRYYTQWNNLVDTFISTVAQVAQPNFELDHSTIQLAQLSGMILAWLESKSPLFIVTNELIDVLVMSQLHSIDEGFFNQLFSGFELLYSDILFLFPLNCNHLSFADDIFGRIDYCIVSKRGSEEVVTTKKDVSKSQPSYEDGVPCFIISGTTTEKFVINLGISNKGDNYDTGYPLSNADKVTLDFRKLIVQCLLLIISKPELIITSDQLKLFSYETSGQGFQKPKNGDKVLYPRVLNLSYAEKKIRSDDNRIQRQGNYSPKSPHWRLGYEVNKPVGKMKGVPREQWERKKIKVAPYFVLGGDDKDDSTEGLSSVGSEFKKTIDNNQEF